MTCRATALLGRKTNGIDSPAWARDHDGPLSRDDDGYPIPSVDIASHRITLARDATGRAVGYAAWTRTGGLGEQGLLEIGKQGFLFLYRGGTLFGRSVRGEGGGGIRHSLRILPGEGLRRESRGTADSTAAVFRRHCCSWKNPARGRAWKWSQKGSAQPTRTESAP